MGSWLSRGTDTNDTTQAQNPYNVDASMQTAQGNEAQIYAQQQNLAQILQQQVAGQGPNPAQAQFQQNTQQNLAQGAGMLASDRSLNPALAAKIAAQATATGGQQAAGQAAVTQAQQQLAAEGQLSGLYGTEANTNVAQQNAINGATENANTINGKAALANQAQGAAQFGALTNAAGGATTNLAQSGSLGSTAQAAAPAAVAAYDGGEISPHMQDMASIYHKDFRSGGKVPGTPKVMGNSPQNDTVKARLSPGEVVIPNDIMQSKDPAGKAAQFVASIVEKKAKDHGDFKEALKRHVAGRKNK